MAEGTKTRSPPRASPICIGDATSATLRIGYSVPTSPTMNARKNASTLSASTHAVQARSLSMVAPVQNLNDPTLASECGTVRDAPRPRFVSPHLPPVGKKQVSECRYPACRVGIITDRTARRGLR
jgi:hypothetical protein